MVSQGHRPWTRSTRLNATGKLDSWNSFVEELKVPSDIFPLLLMRPDLDRLTAARGPVESYSDVIVRLARL